MPRRAKGPRLYLRTNVRDGRTRKPLPDAWVIRDGPSERSTGRGAECDETHPALQLALSEYLAEKYKAPALKADSRRDPAQVLVAEVVALYSQDKIAVSGLDRATFARFVANLLAWWGERTLADIKRSTCQAYAKHRMAQPDARYKDPKAAPRVSSETARRELEMLSASVGHWHGEDTLTTRPVIWLPDKPESPRDALTRSQAAQLLRASLGSRRVEKAGPVRPGEAPLWGWVRLSPSARKNRAHLRRFILIGLYTGTRHSAMRALLWEEALTQAWVDLDKGMIYRRGRGERETTKRRPVVKLPPRLLAHMRRWRRLDAARKVPPNTVLHHGGEPIAGKIRTGFEGCVRDAGLPKDVTPHWMRHTAATWLMEGGVDMWDAAAYLGMSVTTLEKHYGHHRSDHQAAASRGIVARR